MISLVRLDERMIHGQVAVKWSRVLNVDRILVANDEAAADDLIKKSLMMAAPNTVKTAIVSVEKAIGILNDPRGEGLKILVIVRTPDDLLKLAEAVPGINDVNLGNYGRINSRNASGEARPRKQLNLYLYDDEVETLSKVNAKVKKMVYQTMPDDQPVPFDKIAK